MLTLNGVSILAVRNPRGDESLTFSVGSITVPQAALKAAYDAYPTNMIGQIKLVRAFTGLDLKEAKDVCDTYRVLRLMVL